MNVHNFIFVIFVLTTMMVATIVHCQGRIGAIKQLSEISKKQKDPINKYGPYVKPLKQLLGISKGSGGIFSGGSSSHSSSFPSRITPISRPASRLQPQQFELTQPFIQQDYEEDQQRMQSTKSKRWALPLNFFLPKEYRS